MQEFIFLCGQFSPYNTEGIYQHYNILWFREMQEFIFCVASFPSTIPREFINTTIYCGLEKCKNS